MAEMIICCLAAAGLVVLLRSLYWRAAVQGIYNFINLSGCSKMSGWFLWKKIMATRVQLRPTCVEVQQVDLTFLP